MPDCLGCVGRKSIELMKRLFQFVIFGVVLLAAAQPLPANTACDQQQCEGTPVCSVCFDGTVIRNSAMQPIPAGSRSTPQVAFGETKCSYGWCWLRSDGSSSLVATPSTFRLANGRTLFIPVAQFSVSPAVILAARSCEDAAAGTVSRNILFQVFRI